MAGGAHAALRLDPGLDRRLLLRRRRLGRAALAGAALAGVALAGCGTTTASSTTGATGDGAAGSGMRRGHGSSCRWAGAASASGRAPNTFTSAKANPPSSPSVSPMRNDRLSTLGPYFRLDGPSALAVHWSGMTRPFTSDLLLLM